MAEIVQTMKVKSEDPILGAYVNNRVKPLDYELVKPRQVEFFDYSCRDGQRMYIRTLSFVLYSAVRNLWPEVSLRIDHAISKGYYCEIEGLDKAFTDEDLWSVQQEMQSIIDRDIPVERKMVLTETAVELYEKEGLHSKAELFRAYGRLYAPVFSINGHVNFFYGHVLTSTGCITNWGIERYYDGLLLRFPVPGEDERTGACNSAGQTIRHIQGT